MLAKKTSLLVAELRVLADLQMNGHCRNVVLQAADRLEDTDKIAVFYRNKAELLGGDQNGRKRREKRRIKV